MVESTSNRRRLGRSKNCRFQMSNRRDFVPQIDVFSTSTISILYRKGTKGMGFNGCAKSCSDRYGVRRHPSRHHFQKLMQEMKSVTDTSRARANTSPDYSCFGVAGHQREVSVQSGEDPVSNRRRIDIDHVQYEITCNLVPGTVL